MIDKKKKHNVVLIRHGDTILNDKNEIKGWSDIPLNEKGREQAEKTGKELKGSDIEYLVASDLTRSIETAQIISKESGIPIMDITNKLRPWNIGKMAGMNYDKAYPMLEEYATENPEQEIPEGESFDSFKFRCLMGIISILNQAQGKLIGIITHSRNERLIAGWIEAGTPDDLEIDINTFISESEKTGHAEVVELESNYLI